MKKDIADSTVLAGSIRRVLLGVILVGCTLAAIQVVAVSKLQRQIDKWAWTSEMNGQRGELYSQTQAFLSNESGQAEAELLEVFADLRATILSARQYQGLAEFSYRIAELEAGARNTFSEAERRRIANLPLRQETLQRVHNLQDLSTEWSLSLRDGEQRLLRLSNEIDEEIRNIADVRSKLTSALLAAQLLQQQIIAIERLAQTSSLEIAKSSIDALALSGLPSVCQPNAQGNEGRLCSPSIARVAAALMQLKNSELDAIEPNVRNTLWGLEGYIRAGQGRLQALSDEGTKALDSASAVRQDMSNLKTLTSSLFRVNRLLLDITTIVERPETNSAELISADQRIRSLISQLRFRMSGVLRLSPELQGNPDMINANVDVISDNWTVMSENTSNRLGALRDFSETMATLSTGVEEQATLVRGETTLWVKVYVSNFLILSALLVASIIGLILLARRRFILPLAQVTGAILGLAKGELERPLALSERAFGFDSLGNALEQLRQEMSERQMLMDRNREQQGMIEANLSDLERTYKEMQWIALHDPLTGLANRRNADQHLENLTNSHAISQADFCVMQIDIDRFKAVNDALGHAAGDFVLKSVAQILSDLIPQEATSYRIGGDEFLVICPGEKTAEQAYSLAQNLIDQIKLPMDFKGHRCNVGASIGIAFGRDTGGNAMQAVMSADIALYSVKQKGRDGFELFTSDLASQAKRRNDLADRLLAAIEKKSFQPFYQPQFEAKTRQLRGVEVLCRWQDDDFGWISPGDFLPIAEELSIVGAIDEILLQKVSKDLATLSQKGLSLSRVSFNITADRLLKTDLAKDLSDKIGPHAKISLELLESMSLDNPTESVIWAIDTFKENGIEIEIDDFGSDRASLAGLMAINPKAMKIDRSIVIPIVQSERHKDLVKKILDIGAALNIEVVAEGVESEEHAALLTLYGCDALQGFGLARPMPFEQLLIFLDDAYEARARFAQ